MALSSVTISVVANLPEDHIWQCKCGKLHFKDEKCPKCKQTLKGERRKLLEGRTARRHSATRKSLCCPCCLNIPTKDCQEYCPCCGNEFVTVPVIVITMAFSSE